MFDWLKRVLRDPCGDETPAVQSFRAEQRHSDRVVAQLDDFARELREARESRAERASIA